jgi:hypothetical protein
LQPQAGTTHVKRDITKINDSGTPQTLHFPTIGGKVPAEPLNR